MRQYKKELAAFMYCRDLNERELLDLLGHRNSYIRTAAVKKSRDGNITKHTGKAKLQQ